MSAHSFLRAATLKFVSESFSVLTVPPGLGALGDFERTSRFLARFA